jgi:hypothetical protein
LLKWCQRLVCGLALAAGTVCHAQDAGLGEAQKPCFQRWFSIEAVGATVPGAILKQALDRPAAWGRNRSGFAKRAGSLYAQFAAGALIEDGVKAIHPEYTRYRRLGSGGFFTRTGHAIAGTVTAGKPGGGRTPAWSIAASEFGTAVIATAWSPREYRTPGSIATRGATGMAGVAGGNLLREYWPDFKSLFHTKK